MTRWGEGLEDGVHGSSGGRFREDSVLNGEDSEHGENEEIEIADMTEAWKAVLLE